MQFILVPTAKIPKEVAMQYWLSLKMHDLLKYRLCEIHEPDWPDIISMYNQKGMAFFSVIDKNTNRMVAECALEHFVGLSAMIHYSIHPEYHGKQAITLAKESIQQLFSFRRQDNSPWVSTLIGLTPESNRLAVRHIQKIGFKIQCTIPKAFYLAYLDKIDNGILSICEGES